MQTIYIKRFTEVILEKIANYQNQRSGWILYLIKGLTLIFILMNMTQTAARSCIDDLPAPKLIKLKKAIVNLKIERKKDKLHIFKPTCNCLFIT